ncbi:MAG: hypothetical protein RJA22_3034 [Verrucomicrobiota bacterium]
MPTDRPRPGRIPSPPLGWWLRAAVALAGAILLVALLNGCTPGGQPGPTAATNAPAAPAAAVPEVAMDTAQSVVITQDLDFGTARPTLAEALAQIDRLSTPDDGRGRTFAILEAFNGEWQPDGKMRVSLRISTEKPGLARVVFRRTNTELWKSRVTLATNKPPFQAGQLRILFDNGDGKTYNVDGSTNPATILDAMLKEPGLPVSMAWPDGAERELSFIYSSCGCPIKVACRRVGARTERTKAASQVIFPDDPAALAVINRLMAW